jgi:hypothetical protein
METLPGGEEPEPPSQDVRLQPVAGDVLSEVFDGEAVVVQLRTGAYYAFDRFSTTVWERLTAGESLGAVMAAPGPGTAADVLALAHLFCDEELAVADGGLPAPAIAGGESAGVGGVTKFTDMADLLVLDPIHDINLDGDGWPEVGAEAGGSGQSLAG